MTIDEWLDLTTRMKALGVRSFRFEGNEVSFEDPAPPPVPEMTVAEREDHQRELDQQTEHDQYRSA